MFITAAAQIVLAQRFNFSLSVVYRLLLLTTSEPMPSQGRINGLPAHCISFSLSSLGLRFTGAFGLPWARVNTLTPSHVLIYTKGKFAVSQLPSIPLDGYRACFARTARPFTLFQMAISLIFGKRSPHYPSNQTADTPSQTSLFSSSS